MSKKSLLICSCVGLVIPACVAIFLYLSGQVNQQVPKGWFLAGSNPRAYDVGIDQTHKVNGKQSAYLKSKAGESKGFGTLMQQFDPKKFLGKRVRMSAHVRTQTVKGWAGLWLRVDDTKGKRLSFDNMGSRPIKGSTDWKKYNVVLDVPGSAANIAFGVLLGGQGQVNVDVFVFEEVDLSVPVTGLHSSPSLEPVNLDFENDQLLGIPATP